MSSAANLTKIAWRVFRERIGARHACDAMLDCHAFMDSQEYWKIATDDGDTGGPNTQRTLRPRGMEEVMTAQHRLREWLLGLGRRVPGPIKTALRPMRRLLGPADTPVALQTAQTVAIEHPPPAAPVNSSVEQAASVAKPLPAVLVESAAARAPAVTDSIPTAPIESPAKYAEKLAHERAVFTKLLVIHDLPAIYHYWSNRYLRPRFERFGFSHPEQFFAVYLERTFADVSNRPAKFVSLGSGNCDAEARMARELIAHGIEDFQIECVDINAAMLDRGLALAREHAVERWIVPVQGDFNAWQPQGRYDAIIANQSLHHVVALENLFATISGALEPHGRFLTSDMIGRNGHMPWPEAMAVIHELWRELPPEHRYNSLMRRHEEEYEYWDTSTKGFEGIRAQDILPLLIERFDFELFIGFAGIIDPFIGRSFGPHFDVDSRRDREFIDRVQARDNAEMLAGRIKPTHMVAVLRNQPFADRQCWQHLTPEFCVRRPD